MALTEQHIYDALATVKDPELHKDLVVLRMVKGVDTDGDDERAASTYLSLLQIRSRAVKVGSKDGSVRFTGGNLSSST